MSVATELESGASSALPYTRFGAALQYDIDEGLLEYSSFVFSSTLQQFVAGL